MRLQFLAFFLMTVSLTSIVACAPDLDAAQSQTISLASFTENYVNVSITLESTSAGDYLLSATFIPPEGYHLYSKDIPLTGVNGLGRPTLLELTPDSLLQATGILTESLKAQEPNFEPKDLLVYPSSAITLSLPVMLPPGSNWVDDKISITFIACSASQCKPPVMGKIVSIHIPGAGIFDHQ